jgi:hypothetical protein
MKPQPNTPEQFIQIGDKMINIRFVKKVELNGTTLGVTVPDDDGEGEVTHMLHHEGARVFEALKRNCLNYAD